MTKSSEHSIGDECQARQPLQTEHLSNQNIKPENESCNRDNRQSLAKARMLRRFVNLTRWWPVFLPVFLIKTCIAVIGLPDTFSLPNNGFFGLCLVVVVVIGLVGQVFDAVPRSIDGLVVIFRSINATVKAVVEMLERTAIWVYTVFGEEPRAN